MMLSHRQAFELLHQGLDAALQRGLPQAAPIREAVLQALEPSQRQRLLAHWDGCAACRADLELSTGLRREAALAWPPALAPRASASLGLPSGRPPRNAPRRALRLLAAGVLLAGALLALVWVLSSLRPPQTTAPGEAEGTPGLPVVAPEEDLPTPTADPRLAALPPRPLHPFAQGRDVEAGRWSPDGRYLAYTQVQRAADPASDRVYTSYQFFDAETGQTCISGDLVLGNYGFFPGFWLADGRLLVSARDRLLLLTPCRPQAEDISGLFSEKVQLPQPAPAPGQWVVLVGEQAYWLYDPQGGSARALEQLRPTPGDHVFWSPDQQSILISQPAASGDEAQLRLVDAARGETLEKIRLESGRADFAPWVDWLEEGTLLVYGGPDGESQLLRRSEGGWESTPILREIFGVEPSRRFEVQAEGGLAGSQPGGFHLFIALQTVNGMDVYVYHGEDGRIDSYALEYDALLVFSGEEAGRAQTVRLQQMAARQPPADAFQVVQVEQGAVQTLHVGGHTPRGYPLLAPAWLDEHGWIAFGSSQGVSLLDAASGEPLAYWRFTGTDGPLGYVGLTPNPQQAGLLAYAVIEAGGEGSHSALFYVPLEP